MPTPEPQSRIQDYGIIGDCRSAALISRRGSLDWLCWPRFDSPSIFAALLDPERGGFFTTASHHERLIARRKDVDDHPIPSGNSSAAYGLLRLAALTGEHDYE